jgi:rhamnosyltransferase
MASGPLGDAGSGASAAGVVLYNPDPVFLANQMAGLADVALFAFLNGPIDPSALAAMRAVKPHGIRIIESDRNVGLAQGLNAIAQAAAAAGFRRLLLLDQDSEPPAGMVGHLDRRAAALAGEGRRAALVAPMLVVPPEGGYKPLRYAWRERPQPDGVCAVDFAPTSGSLVDLEALAAIGPFRDDFFIAGIDVEWGFRAWSRGYGSYVDSALAMTHRWGEESGRFGTLLPQIMRSSPLRTYYYARNVVATSKLAHVPMRWRLASGVRLAGQFGLLAATGRGDALRAIGAGVRDGLADRLGQAAEGPA